MNAIDMEEFKKLELLIQSVVGCQKSTQIAIGYERLSPPRHQNIHSSLPKKEKQSFWGLEHALILEMDQHI